MFRIIHCTSAQHAAKPHWSSRNACKRPTISSLNPPEAFFPCPSHQQGSLPEQSVQRASTRSTAQQLQSQQQTRSADKRGDGAERITPIAGCTAAMNEKRHARDPRRRLTPTQAITTRKETEGIVCGQSACARAGHPPRSYSVPSFPTPEMGNYPEFSAGHTAGWSSPCRVASLGSASRLTCRREPRYGMMNGMRNLARNQEGKRSQSTNVSKQHAEAMSQRQVCKNSVFAHLTLAKNSNAQLYRNEGGSPMKLKRRGRGVKCSPFRLVREQSGVDVVGTLGLVRPFFANEVVGRDRLVHVVHLTLALDHPLVQEGL